MDVQGTVWKAPEEAANECNSVVVHLVDNYHRQNWGNGEETNVDQRGLFGAKFVNQKSHNEATKHLAES